jgi:DNA segregation ATPase FtsK/SpoIIIE-like protein
MRNLTLPRFLNSPTPFAIIVIIALSWVAFRGCDPPALTPEQRAHEQATLEENQARWAEARADRARREPVDLAVYILLRLVALVLITAAGLGLITTLTLRGWRWAATIAPIGGLFPLVISKAGGRWTIFDANRAVGATTQLSDGDVLVAPGWEQAQFLVTAGAQRVQAEQARSYTTHTTNNAPPTLAAADESTRDVIMNWPNYVPLARYLDAQGGASLDRVFLGVTCDPATGQQQPISMAMDDLVHFAVAGSTGFGKTTFLESLLYQFVKSNACDLAIVDLKSELVAWRDAAALRWPVVTARDDGSAILAACYEELQARKAAFESIGGAKSLADYNARANGAGQFRPLVALLDEGTILLRGDKQIASQAVDLVLLGRSFGLWLVLAGQDFKVSSTASEIRNQLVTRVQFHAADPHQARVLLGHTRAQGLDAGRAICRLRGYNNDVELQAPVITRAEIDALLAGQSGPRQPAPSVEPPPTDDGPTASLSPNEEQRVRELGRQGASTTAIMKDLWGPTGKSGSRAKAINQLLGRN